MRTQFASVIKTRRLKRKKSQRILDDHNSCKTTVLLHWYVSLNRVFYLREYEISSFGVSVFGKIFTSWTWNYHCIMHDLK